MNNLALTNSSQVEIVLVLSFDTFMISLSHTYIIWNINIFERGFMSDIDNSGICYTWSGNEKIYESDLFSAEVNIFSHEYCFRYDSEDSKTLVFGKFSEEDNSDMDEFHSYLPCGGLSINHNIQANGEDHYICSGTYTKPKNWSPPAGLDGPFDSPVGLEYPYYGYTLIWAGSIYTFYNDKLNTLDPNINGLHTYWYGNERKNKY